MNSWRRVDEIITYFGKGVTPKYVDESSVVVLNQKCIRNNHIDYSLAQFIDDSKDYSDIKYLRIGDLLVNSTGQGTAGRVAFVDYIPEGKKVIVDSHILVLRTDSFFESKCLNYSLFSIESTLQTYIDGSTGQGEFDRVRLFNVQVNYPHEKYSQQKIASVLSALDDKIELNNRTSTELEKMAKLIYEYWFVQFDFPFDFRKDKPADETSRAEDIKPYKSAGGKMVWNKELKREIPEGWEVGDLEELSDFNPSLKIGRNAVAPYLGMTSISTSGYMTEIPEEKGFTGGIKFQNGDIVVARITPCLENGKTALITMLEEGSIGFGSTEFINIRAKEKCHISYLAILCRSDSFRNYAISKMTGTSGRKRVDAKELAKFRLPVPPDDLLKKYGDLIDPYFQKMTSNANQNQELASLRDWLLPMLMNGQVTVADAEVMVEEKLGMVAEERVRYEKGKV